MWQKLMIALARNKKIKTFVQSRKSMNILAKKFVGGSSKTDVLKKCQRFANDKIYASLYFLGEYVTDIEEIEKTTESLLEVAEQLGKVGLDIHISVDPTQIGLGINEHLCYSNLETISGYLDNWRKTSNGHERKILLMIDMEDASVCAQTLSYYHKLQAAQLPVGITLQAYLYRTENDLRDIIQSGGTVRVVKGAFAEKPTLALTTRFQINEQYTKLATMMLSEEAKNNGLYPVFATHDENQVDKIASIATANKWEKDEYEFEMLYGVREELQRKLVQKGYTLRIYMPFGKDWWPYAVRRIGENPGNIKYVFKNL